MDISISVHVHTNDPERAAKAAEVLARACTGLVLEGIDASLSMFEHGNGEDHE